MNGKQYPNIKRYHIAKVYRRDQPAMTKGRMREFYQCVRRHTLTCCMFVRADNDRSYAGFRHCWHVRRHAPRL